MKKTFNIIEIPNPLPEIHPIKVKFDNDHYIYDFSMYGDNEIARACAKVFFTKNAHLTYHTRGRGFVAIKKYLKFMSENKITKIAEISSQYLISYAQFLDTQNLSISTKYSNYNEIESVLNEIKKINQQFKCSIPSNPFREIEKERPIPKKITSDNLKKVLAICYEQIDATLTTFRNAKEKNNQLASFFEEGGQFNKNDKDHVIYYFYQKYGYAPIAENLNYEEKQLIRGLRNFSLLDNAITPNVHALLPFYLVLVFELAGNSDAIRQIDVDCMEDDPLFEDRALIIWNKNRASSLQRRNVLKNKKYGAYKIISWIKEITENTRKQVVSEEKNYLFVYKAGQEKRAFSVPQKEVFKNACKNFCKEHKLDFNFNPSEIRPSVLTEIYKKNKDIVSISKIANHKNIETTLLYIVDEETKKLNRESISLVQDNLINKIMKKDISQSDNIDIKQAENIGFICKTPIVDNKLCINWMSELTNPNLIIPEDEKYLSKIIALKSEIIRNKKFVQKDRYNLLYQPVLFLIDEQILPKFNKKLIDTATELSKKIKIPSLGEM